ncbi:MAG: hypothetical protein IH977_14140 [Nitrospinae bacterium]|nr:hypothetical protein [Nitrospinota bacterium]
MANRNDKPFQHQVDCYVKWLRLTESIEYREASQEIRRLQERVSKADERYSAAHVAYVPCLEPNVPDSTEKQIIKQKYWTAEKSARKAQEALTAKEAETCQMFGLLQWWDPDDPVTIKDATDIFSPCLSVVVLDPAPDKRVDFYATVGKEGRRTLEREGTWIEPHRMSTNADKDGWLTLKVNLNASLEASERAIRHLLRVNRVNPPQTRTRPDKVAEALEAWVCYEETKQFSAVAKQLQRPVNTVKGQYVRACDLIHGQRPTGSIKQRRIGMVRDPAREFNTHYTGCAKCRKAKTPEEFCPRWVAWVNQDAKALREQLSSNPIQ